MTAPKILDATADDAATINGWTDRNPATIVKRTPKTIVVQRDSTSQMTKPENVESGAAFANGRGDVVIYTRDYDAPLVVFKQLRSDAAPTCDRSLYGFRDWNRNGDCFVAWQ
jgi:3-oxoacyl-[acyl-carrier-protein] synthase III